MSAILATKLGMTQVFKEDGSVERVTVLAAGPCPVTAVRTAERDGYDAVQLAFGQAKRKRLSKAELGHLQKADAPPLRRLVEFREETELQLGNTVTVEAFEVGGRVKVSGTAKGKGFQGTIKRHNFTSGPKSHGSHNIRAPGSIGASATPSRVFRGLRGPGQMGNRRATQKGLEIVAVDGKRAALRSALSLHAERGSVAILDASAFQEPKTRQARELLQEWGQARPTLVVLAPGELAAARSFRNLARVSVRAAPDVGVSDLLGA